MASVIELQKRTSKNWTYEDYCRLDGDRRYEILDGELIPMEPPGPSSEHQDASFELVVLLRNFVEARGLGRVYMAPLDVKLAANNVVQPDSLFVSQARMSILQSRGIFGAPDLVVEVVSQYSEPRDREKKRELYARFGVSEYWLVDEKSRSLQVLALESKSYVEHVFAEGKGQVTSRVLKGLKVKISDVFRL